MIQCSTSLLKCFILSSLYENPGHVLIESAFCNCPIISSNCPTGPEEFLNYGDAGYLYEVNNQDSLLLAMNKFINDDHSFVKNKKYAAKLNCKNFSQFRHLKTLENLLIK